MAIFDCTSSKLGEEKNQSITPSEIIKDILEYFIRFSIDASSLSGGNHESAAANNARQKGCLKKSQSQFIEMNFQVDVNEVM